MDLLYHKQSLFLHMNTTKLYFWISHLSYKVLDFPLLALKPRDRDFAVYTFRYHIANLEYTGKKLALAGWNWAELMVPLDEVSLRKP